MIRTDLSLNRGGGRLMYKAWAGNELSSRRTPRQATQFKVTREWGKKKYGAALVGTYKAVDRFRVEKDPARQAPHTRVGGRRQYFDQMYL
jgi:hypothetical protein